VHSVDPGEANGVASHPPDHGGIVVVDLSRELGVPRSKALRYALVSRGEWVDKGELLARRAILGPLCQRSCGSPVAGRVTELTDGLIFIRVSSPASSEGARVDGSGPGTEAEREERTAVVRGVWGAGGTARGPLHVLASGPGERLEWKGVGLECKGNIIVVGAWLDRAILLRAVRFRVRGVVAGGIDPDLVAEARHSSVPVLITEGAGLMPINRAIFELLTGHEGAAAVICGGERGPGPQLVIPLASEDDAASATELPGTRPLRAGDMVRVTRPPYQGYTGRVISAKPRLTVYRSGVKSPAVWIQLSDGRRVYVPYTNLELMGG